MIKGVGRGVEGGKKRIFVLKRHIFGIPPPLASEMQARKQRDHHNDYTPTPNHFFSQSMRREKKEFLFNFFS